jgi:hypothetical protein
LDAQEQLELRREVNELADRQEFAFKRFEITGLKKLLITKTHNV